MLDSFFRLACFLFGVNEEKWVFWEVGSATYLVLQQISSNLLVIQREIKNIKDNLRSQDEQIIEKVKTALRQEITTITQ